jgi:ribosome-associated protein
MSFAMKHDDEGQDLSKTRRKHAMKELQALGEALSALPLERLKKIGIPEDLREAIDAVRRMTRRDEARRRQMQYIGRLMRGVDSEAIRLALACLKAPRRAPPLDAQPSEP